MLVKGIQKGNSTFVARSYLEKMWHGLNGEPVLDSFNSVGIRCDSIRYLYGPSVAELHNCQGEVGTMTSLIKLDVACEALQTHL
jgi:hypothetical protein